MAKMTSAIATRVRALGITATTEEEARTALVSICNSYDCTGMDDEDLDILLDVVETFRESNDVPLPSEASVGSMPTADENVEEPTEAEALAAEAAAEEQETPTAPAPTVDDEEEEEDEPESLPEDDVPTDYLDTLDRTALKDYIKINELDLRVKKAWSDAELRDQIRAVEAAEKVEQEKKAAAAAAKKEAKTATVPEEKKTTTPARQGGGGHRLNPQKVEEDRQIFYDTFGKVFPVDEFEYAWVSTAGVSIKHKGVNNRRQVAGIESCAVAADGTTRCTLYFNTMAKQMDKLVDAGLEPEVCWSGVPFVRGYSMEEAAEILTQLKPIIVGRVESIDKRLGVNREKMENSLKASGKTASAVKK